MELRIGDVFASAARVAPHGVAATAGDRSLTFAALDHSGNRLAHVLRGLGIGRGDRVAWWGGTSLDAIAVFVALAKLGAVFAPLNARFGVDEVEPVVEMYAPRLLLSADTHTEAAAEVARRHSLPLAHQGPGPGTDVADAADRAADTAPSLAPDAAPRETDTHVVFFTSGTTGRPKGVVLSHRVNWLRTAASSTGSPGGAGVVCMFPLFHMAGWTIALGAWQARRPVHLVPDPEPGALLAAAAHHRASRLYCIPAVWARILEHGVHRHDLSALAEADTGTSATPPELLAALRDALPHTATRVFYGSTEAGPGTLLTHDDFARKPGSVGVPQPSVDVRLDDHGEVCMRSPYLFDGYLDDPEATAAALRDGWYHTGDLGAVDDEGYLSIVGRARDVIRSGGETIAPGEVEAVLAGHEAVREVAVVGVPDATWGEVVTAVVVLRAGAPPVDVDVLRTHCAGRLAPFKHPRRVEVVDALPRTGATGQIQRSLLVERLLARPAPR